MKKVGELRRPVVYSLGSGRWSQKMASEDNHQADVLFNPEPLLCCNKPHCPFHAGQLGFSAPPTCCLGSTALSTCHSAPVSNSTGKILGTPPPAPVPFGDILIERSPYQPLFPHLAGRFPVAASTLMFSFKCNLFSHTASLPTPIPTPSLHCHLFAVFLFYHCFGCRSYSGTKSWAAWSKHADHWVACAGSSSPTRIDWADGRGVMHWTTRKSHLTLFKSMLFTFFCCCSSLKSCQLRFMDLLSSLCFFSLLEFAGNSLSLTCLCISPCILCPFSFLPSSAKHQDIFWWSSFAVGWPSVGSFVYTASNDLQGWFSLWLLVWSLVVQELSRKVSSSFKASFLNFCALPYGLSVIHDYWKPATPDYDLLNQYCLLFLLSGLC